VVTPTIPTVPLQTVIPHPDIELPPDRVVAYQEEQQVRAHAHQVDTECRATQQWGELGRE
jgi:hypothetical protein